MNTRNRANAHAERARVLRSRNHFWRPSDLRCPESTRQHLLAALVEAGELRHIRRGLYWRGRSTPLGMSPPPTDALVDALAPGPGVGPAGLYAANMLKLSTQVPRRALIAVPSRAPAGYGTVTFADRAARSGRHKAQLNHTEVAVLEVLHDWHSVVEIPEHEAWKQLAELIHSRTIRPERLAKAADTEPATARVRLGDLLDATGCSEWAQKIPAADARTAKRTRLAVRA